MGNQVFSSLEVAISHTRNMLQDWGKEVDTGHWQGIPTGGRPDLLTKELLNWGFTSPVPHTIERLVDQVQPNLPWADEHFAERVGRSPTNPGTAYKSWPWWTSGAESAAKYGGGEDYKFTHTYQERFWSRRAGDWRLDRDPNRTGDLLGIRYRYGDLDDLVNLLLREPHTRQAYLPIFFPEDTGAVHGGRIPCTLGYQFILRNNKLHMWYFIRSCDYVRHFRDDIYLAARLLLWVINQVQGKEQISLERVPEGAEWVWCDVIPGNFNMTICSLHYHKGDEHLVNKED